MVRTIGIALAHRPSVITILIALPPDLSMPRRAPSRPEAETSPPAPERAMPCIAGLDPSATGTGCAVFRGADLVEAGDIQTSPDTSEPERLWYIFEALTELFRTHQVTEVAAEQFQTFYRSRRPRNAGGGGFSSPLAQLEAQGVRRGRHDHEEVNPSSMFLMKAAQTAAQLAAMQAGCALFLYAPPEWKSTVAPYLGVDHRRAGSIQKPPIRDIANRLYGHRFSSPIRSFDICDGIMIAHHHLVQRASGRAQGFQPSFTAAALPPDANASPTPLSGSSKRR